jgi:hypothetical protein
MYFVAPTFQTIKLSQLPKPSNLPNFPNHQTFKPPKPSNLPTFQASKTCIDPAPGGFAIIFGLICMDRKKLAP